MELQSFMSAAWLSIALLAAVVAGLQGRSKLWWFFITLVFGPLALLFLAIWTEPLRRDERG
ncbi:hypothetical protein [Microbacterium esteraromaticum]|uniref:hypothetical protein n=1 Tax=Microbacterium esteraromaticum TaxID=57043 RepID=UPI001C945625|nr:hypothetical protein [Microbacterium esteraromaticum]MBY6059998.1 hypothetical protein [Microbacterium esteraromaticum]